MFQMHPVAEPRRKIYLIHSTGEIYVYDGYNQFLSILRHDILDSMGKSFGEIRYTITKSIWSMTLSRVRKHISWVAHWNHKSGSVIDPDELILDWKEYHNEIARKRRYSNSYWSSYHREYIYRYDSMPFVHKHHGHKGTYFRHMKTTQERRWSYSIKEDDVKCRAKRNSHNLPNSCDDICRNLEKNWKKFRKNQWKN